MSMTGRTFDWRGFWADLLGGAGRSLLELDGSREAQVALSGLDHFEAARRRRHAGHEAADASQDKRAVWDRIDAPPSEEESREDDGGRRDRAEPLDPGVYHRRIAAALGLAPSARPAPLSADPYDHPGLPVRIQLGQRGLIRRR